MTAVLGTPPFIFFNDNDGNPLSGGLIYTYAAGTTTPQATFTDSTGLIAQTNPIVLDSAGRAVWFINGSYKYIVKDSLGNTIRTVDNVTSFSTLAASSDAFFQTFSGTGSQTAFTLSTDQGTDSKALMVFVDNGLQANITNGNFATDTVWTKGAGWTIAAGVATAAGAISTGISQSAAVTLVAGTAYAVTYTITRSAGGLIPSIGGQNGTERTASGTYREVIVAGSTQTVAFTGNAFTGTLDDVSVTVAASAGYNILSPSAYTVNGTALTLSVAPATGTNNIYVFSPSSLVGAASSAAALAQTYAANALASQTAAAASAALAAISIKWRAAVVAATTGNITLSGAQTIDGVSVIANDRVLVKSQTNSAENGVYICAAGAWTRATDADTWDELVSQAVTSNGGTVNNKLSFVNTNELGGTLGTDAVNWTQLLVYPAANSVTTASLDSAGIAPIVTSINGGQVAGFRNRIINGGMQVAQRGNVTCTNASYYGGADRFINVTTATTVTAGTVLRETDTAAKSGYAQRFSGLTTTGSTTVGIKTRLEDASVFDFNSKTVTVSGKAYQDTGSTLSLGIALQKANALNNFGAITQIGSTQNFSIPSATSTDFYASFTLGATDATNGIQIDALYNAISAVTTKNFRFEDLQIELGSVVTPFEMRAYPIELSMCQTYYEKSFPKNTAPAQNAGTSGCVVVGQIVGASTACLAAYVPFKVTKRSTTSTVTVYNPSAANAQVRNASTASDCSATSVGVLGDSGLFIATTTPAASSAGNSLQIHWSADSEL